MNTPVSKTVRISGILKIKRSMMYVSRYVEITDTFLSYFKHKGDNTSRFTVNLKEVQYSESKTEDSHTICLNLKHSTPSKENKEFLKIKFFSEPEFKAWRAVIMDIVIDSELPVKRRSFTAGPAIPQDRSQQNTLKAPQEEEKETPADSLGKNDLKRKISTSHQHTPRGVAADAISNSVTNQHSPMLPPVENEFLVNSAGDSLPALKAQVFNFKREGYEPLILVNCQENHRIFLGPKTVTSEHRKKKNVVQETKLMEKIRKLLLLDEFFNPVYVYLILSIVFGLIVLGLYLAIEILGFLAVLLISVITLYFLNRSHQWFSKMIEMFLPTDENMASFMNIKENIKKVLIPKAIKVKEEHKLKAVATITASVNEILFCLHTPETRKYWQCYVTGAEVKEFKDKQQIIRYNKEGKKYAETCTLTVYKDDNVLYAIEHQGLSIFRIFEMTITGSMFYTNVTLYMKVSSSDFSTFKSNNAPFLLLGISSYITEQKADPTSILSRKYKFKPSRSSWFFRNAFNENQSEEDKSMLSMSEIGGDNAASRKGSLLELAEEKAALPNLTAVKRNSST